MNEGLPRVATSYTDNEKSILNWQIDRHAHHRLENQDLKKNKIINPQTKIAINV